MFDSLYNLIYNAIFANSTNITPELAQEITSWLSVAGNVILIALPFAVVFSFVRFISHLGR